MPPVSTASPERTHHMLLHLLPAISAAMFGAAGCQDQPTVVRLPQTAADVAAQDTVLAPSADTYLRQGSPNQNQGTELILRLQSSGKNRVLLRWDQQALVQAVGGGAVTSARLELTIADLGDNWSTAGRTIELRRMTQAWTELGATWNCAVDSVPGNARPECAGATAWDMDHAANYPFLAETTATALLRNGQTGVVSFDVTADVLAWLAGQPNNGWLLKKTVEGDPGKVDFGSRESAAGPRLTLTVVAGDTARPELPDTRNYFFPTDTAFSVASPGDTAIRYYRTVVGILFDDTTSGVTVRRVLADYRATIIGGLKNLGAYIVRVPDPGPSYAAVDSLISRLSSEPGVQYAFGAAIHDAVRRLSRFPSDGTGASRPDWLTPTANSITWPQLAVRATLAWGCETGTYGGEPVDVGILDETFDPSPSVNPDLAPSLVDVLRPSSALAMNPDFSLHTIADFSHGTAAAGLLTAAGDNNQGVAGMAWKSRLHVFLVGRSDSIVADAAWYLANDAFPAAAAAGARVLSSSIVVGGNDFNRVRVIQDGLQLYIKAGRGGLFVQAVGDERTTLSIDALQSVHSDVGLLQAAVNIQHGPDGGRVLIVAGTQPSNAWWDDGETFGSNLVRGATEIAAPAADIVSLANGSGTLPPESGTSYSAPMVAGVAAQLWAMDPDLTPEQVKSYILRGARQKRLSSTTGDSVAVSPVIGAPETIYQLDAYGALSLLSAEQPGTPICGFPVGIPSDGRSVVLERPAGPEPLNVGSDTVGVMSVSVAQGGRLVSSLVVAPAGYDIRTVVTDQRGTVLQELPGIQRVYLERDAVDAAPGGLGLDPTYTLTPPLRLRMPIAPSRRVQVN